MFDVVCVEMKVLVEAQRVGGRRRRRLRRHAQRDAEGGSTQDENEPVRQNSFFSLII